MDVFSYLRLVSASCATLSAKFALTETPRVSRSMELESVTPGHVLLEILVYTKSFNREASALADMGLTADALEQCVRGMSSRSSHSDQVIRNVFDFAAEQAVYRDDKLGPNQTPLFSVPDLACACIASGDAAIETLIKGLGISVFDLLVCLGAPEQFTAQFFPYDDVNGFELCCVASYTGARD